MFKSLSIVFVAFLVQGALSQVVLDGQCPEVKPLNDFNFAALLGRYYGISHFPESSPILNNTRCIYVDLVQNGENTAVDYAVALNIDTGRVQTQDIPFASFGDGALAVGLNGAPLDVVNAHVLGTDYKNWALVHSCQNISETQCSVVSWLLSRKSTLDSCYVAKAYELLEQVNLEASQFVPYDQQECIFYE